MPQRTIALLIVLLLAVPTTVGVLYWSTGPWTEAGKAKKILRGALPQATSDLESSYSVYARATQSSLDRLSSLGIADFNRVIRAREGEEPLFMMYIKQAQQAEALLRECEEALTLLYRKRKITRENLDAFERYRSYSNVHLSYIESWNRGTLTVSEIGEWIANASRIGVASKQILAEFEM